jgi:hypothetical protein
VPSLLLVVAALGCILTDHQPISCLLYRCVCACARVEQQLASVLPLARRQRQERLRLQPHCPLAWRFDSRIHRSVVRPQQEGHRRVSSVAFDRSNKPAHSPRSCYRQCRVGVLFIVVVVAPKCRLPIFAHDIAACAACRPRCCVVSLIQSTLVHRL